MDWPNTIRVKGPQGPIEAEIHLPFSKSIINRWLVMAYLSSPTSNSSNPTFKFIDNSSPQDVVYLKKMLFEGGENLYAGHAGTAARFGLAAKCTEAGIHLLSGTERLNTRPIGLLVDGLRRLGARIDYMGQEGCLPLRIHGGKLESNGPLEISGSLSSQFISALLLVAPYVKNGLILEIKPPVLSRTYIDMTLSMMRSAGIDIKVNKNTIRVFPGQYRPEEISPERDWSSASYFLAALYLQGEGKLSFPSLKMESIQGDARIAAVFSSMGMEFTESETGLTALLRPGAKKKPGLLKMDFTDIPDMVQTFVAICLRDGLKAEFTGCDNLDLKETARLQKLMELIELSGEKVHYSTSSEIRFEGPAELQLVNPLPLETHDDHRMAMSQALLACRGAVVEMKNPEVVKKSFPTFWEELRKGGFE